MQTELTIVQQMDAFKAATGKHFFFVGDGKEFKQRISDEVEGINEELQTVIGVKGEYPVEWCRLKQEQPQSLKQHLQGMLFS